MTLDELRKQFPGAYDDMSNGQLAWSLHQKHYSDMPMGVFADTIKLSRDGFKEMVGAAKESGYEPTAKAYSEDNVPEHGKARAAFQGMTFGGGDELVAGAGAAIKGATGGDMGEAYDRLLKEERDRIKAYRQNRPVQSTVAEMGGAVAIPGLGTASALRGGSLGARMGAGAFAGAAEGAGYGYLAGEGDDRLRSARDTAMFAAPFGAAAPALGSTVSRVMDALNNRSARKAAVAGAPTGEALRREASDIFSTADKKGGMPRDVLTRETPDILDRAVRSGMDEDLTPGAAKAASRLEEAATAPDPGVSFREIDILRKKAGVPAGNMANRTESAIGSQMVDDIDKVIETLDPALGAEVARARDLWGRMRRSEVIENAINRADLAGSGFENGLRNEFRRILKSDKLRRGFGESEIEAMKEVVKGSTFGNIMRKVGRMMSFGRGQQTNMLGGGLSAAAGYGLLGPAGAAIPGVTGAVTQKLAESSTGRAAEVARALTAAGGAPRLTNTSPATRMVIEELMRRGGRAAAPQLAR